MTGLIDPIDLPPPPVSQIQLSTAAQTEKELEVRPGVWVEGSRGKGCRPLEQRPV